MNGVSYFTNLRELLLRSIAIGYLQRTSKEHVRRYPRMAILSFDFIGHSINVFGRYEKAELEALAGIIEDSSRRGTALDVGANIGNHSIFLADLFSRVHAFEPNPALVPLLEYNVREHPNVTVHPFGASSSDISVEAEIPSTNVGGGAVRRDPSGGRTGGTFKLRRLDDVPELLEADAIDFIKIDVEGHEIEALEGMAALIERHRPLIAIEQNASAVREGSTDAVDRLRGLGYRYLYEIRPVPSRVPVSLPAFLRFPLRLLEAAARDPSATVSVEPVTSMTSRDYPMLLVSRQPLIFDGGQRAPPGAATAAR